MREVIRGVVDVLNTASLRRADERSHDDGETFVLPSETEDTREDTAYAASETRDTSPAERRGTDGERQKGRARTAAPVKGERGGSGTERAVRTPQPTDGARGTQGVERVSLAGASDAATEGLGRPFFTEEAMSLARGLKDGDAPEAQSERGSSTLARLSEAAQEALGRAQSEQEGESEDAVQRLDAARLGSRRQANEVRANERREVATTAVGRRLVVEQSSQESVKIGQASEGDALMVEEAADEAFNKAQALRDQGSTSEQPSAARLVDRLPSGLQVMSAPTPPPTADVLVPESMGSSSVTETLMEEIMVAQRGAAGGDRVGDSDAIIRVSEGTAGALQVKVKREGDDLTLRVRAEDLAMRQVMAESFPELKTELQRANLVEGEIEIREDGIEDQMQDDYSWDGAEAQGRQDQDENAYESERASAERGGDSRRSDASTTRQHDGELHVVA